MTRLLQLPVYNRGAVARRLELHALQKVGVPVISRQVILKEPCDPSENRLTTVVEAMKIVTHRGPVVERHVLRRLLQQGP